MSQFINIDPTLDAYWRAIILFGRNSASYKFALGKGLLEIAYAEKTFITLDELAEPPAAASPYASNSSGSNKNVCAQTNTRP
jgi:hypothetical protein